MLTKTEHVYGVEISEDNKRLWVGKIKNGTVINTLYTDTWGGNRMKGTRETVIKNAKLIAAALNTFDSSVDAPYCHDLEQRIELLEMDLAEAQAKATAYDRLMGHKKTLKDLANVLHRPVAMDKYGVPLAFNDIPIAGREGWIYEQDQAKTSYVLRGDPIRTVVDYDFSGDWKTSLTLPDGWEDK